MLIIKREYFKTYTKGTLILPNGTELFSLELPWLDNKPFSLAYPKMIISLYAIRMGGTLILEC